MAEETVDRAIMEGFLKKSKCVTRDLKLTSLPAISGSERFRIYGDNSADILRITELDPESGNYLDPRLPYIRAELIWICRNEMPLFLEDVLARRTRSLFLNARASAEIAPLVAEIMAKEFGYDKKWEKEQVDAYKDLVRNYL